MATQPSNDKARGVTGRRANGKAKHSGGRAAEARGAGSSPGSQRVRARRPDADRLAAVVAALRAVRAGDFSVRLDTSTAGDYDALGEAFNEVVAFVDVMSHEVARVANVVGREGKMTERASLSEAHGAWAHQIDAINMLIGDLARPSTEVARVITAVASGDLSQKMVLEIDGKPIRGEFLRIGTTVNIMVDQLNAFAREVTRVAREVGTEGKLGGQASVPGVGGTWKDLTDNVNAMAGNLTVQLRDVSKVATAIANGDLTQKITVGVQGEILQIKDVINKMVDQLSSFASEVTRVAKEVGTEGKLGGQADVPGVAGTWKDLTDNVNYMASNLTSQVRGIATVVTAVANGDLSRKFVVEAKGEVAALADTINNMTDTLRVFAAQVTTVAREVATEGKLGGQAEVPGVAGTWKDLTDNVNYMARNLTDQVRNIALVTTAVANGDLSQKIGVDVKGEMLELKNTINTMVDQLRAFAAEVTRVAREVGTEGKLGGQANVPGVGGTWKDLTDNVNYMAGNLTVQLRDVSKVATAIAGGDLTQKITVAVQGEILQIKDVINTMVDQLSSFASEVTRVAKEVGTEGKLGGQANVPGVGGTWKDLTDNVNYMAGNLTGQVRNIALVTTAVANGDLSQKIGVDVKGEMLELKNTINTMVDQLRAFAAEVTRVAREVGTEGKLGGQANVPGVGGTWKDLTDNVNYMAGNLTVQLRDVSKVATAIAGGDLTQKITVEVQGEILQIKNVINKMVDQLSSFASEVTRVAREVGTEGKLGGQARVPGVAGTWKDLTDNVNAMAGNLTVQLRDVSKVATAIANGDLTQEITVEVRGEILQIKDVINKMVDQLSSFASEVTRVAREVGTEGKLGGQARVPGASGTWRDLTDNVNQLAGNLTAQVRAIADVATAVTKGDLTRFITVEAQGELSALKDNINQMITNLRETTQKNQEQDWLKTNIAKFSGMMQGQKSLEAVSRLIMSQLTPLVSAHHGAFYIAEGGDSSTATLKLVASYAYKQRKNVSNRFRFGEGLVGQCALEKKSIVLTHVPEDYIKISSGLGEASPLNIIVLPVLFEGEARAVVELASFRPFSDIHQIFLDQLSESIGVVLNMIGANVRTEELLLQSQSLTQELQNQSRELQQQQDELRRSNAELEAQARSLKASEELLKDQQEELQQINEELEEKAALLAEQNAKVETKNREVELARSALEEKAEQVALSSKYKSEFLANMSHELRTPLNSLLILAKLLSDNKDGNLSHKQVEYSQTIYASGTDLLNLINEVLDLSKVEAGKMEIYASELPFDEIEGYLDRSFRPLAQQKGLSFAIRRDADVPQAIITDSQRLQQILRNLLANAFKFTEHGEIQVRTSIAEPGKAFDSKTLLIAPRVLAIAVIDTGIGIAAEKQRVIFEAFQQADGTTSRKYGGTGLGLSISRELSRLLGGEIHVTSIVGEGSTFTLFLPERYIAPERPAGDPALPSPSGEPPPLGSPEVAFAHEPIAGPNELGDDRDAIVEGDRVLLIIEDDPAFARLLVDMARERGFRVVAALRGDTGLAYAHRFSPDAILLDLGLPVVDGLTVLERLKQHSDTRHIPVHILSAADKRQRGLGMGAVAYLEKPVSKEAIDNAFTQIGEFLQQRVRQLLIVEDDDTQRKSIAALIGDTDVAITAVGTAEEALAQLSEKRFDCMVLDLGLPDMTGFDLLERVKAQEPLRVLPIVVYTGRDLTKQEETQLKKYAETIIIKDTRSPERLLEETALFLHRVGNNMQGTRRRSMEHSTDGETVFSGKKVLVVDDDVRNIFALASVLESQGMIVVFAENGNDGIAALERTPDIDLVLMDVMMPELDGYDTMRAIRGFSQFKDLPIIALTAKAMKGDREKCLAAGASDYITKPVDANRLLSLIRVWLYR